MPNRDIIVIGTSAGGVEALRELTRGLPPDLAAAVFIVIHIPATSASLLPEILNCNGPLPARHAVDGEAIERGRIDIAPPDHHMLIERSTARVVRCPKVNRARPAVDPLFRSAARAHGPRVIGVVLTGMLDDGTAGLLAIKRRGGLTAVQDPRDALYPSMPRSALKYVAVDYCLPLSGIPSLSLVKIPSCLISLAFS
jgi:two-component system, chemotaxis family, protein-glutamate methylesterase/glutaminase